jgi:hypothetical protein
MPHGAEGRPLVALLEGMSLRYRSQESDGERNDVFFAVGESILGPCQRAFEQTDIAEEVSFSGFFHLKPIVLDYRVDWQPAWLIWQGRLGASGTGP